MLPDSIAEPQPRERKEKKKKIDFFLLLFLNSERMHLKQLLDCNSFNTEENTHHHFSLCIIVKKVEAVSQIKVQCIPNC